MGNLTLSEKYGIGAAVGLLLMAAINNSIVMLAISAVGIVAGLWVLRQGEARRVAFVAVVAFAIAAALAVINLVRAA